MDTVPMYATIFFIITSSLLALLIIKSIPKYQYECPFCGNESPQEMSHCDKCIGV